MCEFGAKWDMIDSATPRYNPLSARYKKSFAFYTLTERYPVILTQIVEHLNRDKNEIARSYGGEKTLKEINYLIESITRLKHKLLTDEKFEKFSGSEPDKELWNNFLQQLAPDFCSFFHSNWLHAECYLYRKLASFFERTKTLQNYDYFAKQKQNNLTKMAVLSVVKGWQKFEKDFKTFDKLLKLNLWANIYDLQVVLAKALKFDETLFDQLDTFNDKLLINNSKEIWQCLVSADRSKPLLVEFVNDNAGFELFTDLLLAGFLIDKQLAAKVRFSVKALPWFISDAVASDISWTLDYLSKFESSLAKRLAAKWKQYFKDKQFVISPVHYYWVSPYEYYKMRELAPDLYQYLTEAHLLIFKGDLNYRKLLGDMNWDPTDEFITCIRGFRPTNFCSLRPIKTDLICGLAQGKAEQLHHLDNRWMLTADYAVIQFMEERFCDCHKPKK